MKITVLNCSKLSKYNIYPSFEQFKTFNMQILKHVFSFENENDIHEKYSFNSADSDLMIRLSPSHKMYIIGNQKISDVDTGANIVEFNNIVKSISCDATDSKLFLVKTENEINRLFIYYLAHIVDDRDIIRELDNGVNISDLQDIILDYLPNSELLVLPLPFNEVEVRTIQLVPVELLDIFDVGEEE
jgi:hypothetical protein